MYELFIHSVRTPWREDRPIRGSACTWLLRCVQYMGTLAYFYIPSGIRTRNSNIWGGGKIVSTTYDLNSSMEHSRGWEANRHSASQEIYRSLFHYRVYKIPLLVPILSQWIQTTPWLRILLSHFLSSSLLLLYLPRDLFSSDPTKILHAFFAFHACYILRPSHPSNIWLRV